jgi:hypothetical protein
MQAAAQDLHVLAKECREANIDLSPAPWLSGFVVGALKTWQEILDIEAAHRAGGNPRTTRTPWHFTTAFSFLPSWPPGVGALAGRIGT